MKNDTLFPNFLPLDMHFYNAYQEFMFGFPQHCDFALNNLQIWLGGTSKVEYTWINDNIFLKITGSIYSNQLNEEWYTVVGNSNADETLRAIFDTIPTTQLFMVPDYFVDSIQHPDNYVITEDENNRDYILMIEDLLKKSGKKYENFRYQINYFLTQYSEEAIIKEIDLGTANGAEQIINAINNWPSINSFGLDGNDPTRVDEKAILKLIELQPILPVKHHCIGLFIDGSLQGFSIYHIPKSQYSIALGNHIKYNSEYKRLFDFLVYATASKLKSNGIQLLNAEQDMGIEGLRRHKNYLRPFTYYKKYSISKK